jgi:hypothetical protein
LPPSLPVFCDRPDDQRQAMLDAFSPQSQACVHAAIQS